MMDEGLDAVVAVVDVAGAARSMPPVRSSIVILLVPDDRPATMTPDGQFTDGNDECDDESLLSLPPLCNAPGVAKIEGGGKETGSIRIVELTGEKKISNNSRYETNVEFTQKLKFVTSSKCK